MKKYTLLMYVQRLIGEDKGKNMELIILASGTGQPLADRGSPALALLLDEGIVLFDVGPGTLRQLSRIGINHDKIGHIGLLIS